MKEEALIIEVQTQEGSKTPPHLQLVPTPSRITQGKDELNFAEFPLSSLSERPDPSIKTIEFEDKIFDKSRNEWVHRKVTISGSDKYGLPVPTDEAVLLALIQLSKLQNFESRRVYFTRYQLLQILKWTPSGQNYARLDEALNRWMGVTMFYKNSWRDKKLKTWGNQSFHMLENLKTYGAEEKERVAEASGEVPLCYFEWNDVVFRSFQNGNVKSLNYEFFLSIETSLAKRLYRFLDKRFYHASEVDFDLKTLAYEHVGISRNSPIGDLKRKMNVAIDELEQKGFLSPKPREQRFVKQAPGIWRVYFRKKHSQEEVELGESNTIDVPATKNEESSIEQLLVQFGIREQKAAQLVAKYPKELIEEQIAVMLWTKERNPARVANNPAGFLISSIEKEYDAPRQFKHERQNKVEKQRTSEASKIRAAREEEKVKKHEAREHEKRQALEAFWSSLDPTERRRIENDALSSADPAKRKMIAMGGRIGEAAKQIILNNFALELLANG